MTVRRKYDIGGGVTIEDDGYVFYAQVKYAGGSTASVGVTRPVPWPKDGDDVEIVYNEDGKLFYPSKWTGFTDGFWLSVDKWESKEAMLATMPKGFMNDSGASFKVNDETYYRQVFHFAFWKIKGPNRVTEKVDDKIKDYLSLRANQLQEEEKRFNETIAPSGRTLAWIAKKIGPWVPVDEVPVVTLTDDIVHHVPRAPDRNLIIQNDPESAPLPPGVRRLKRKPVVVEAMQFTTGNVGDVLRWINGGDTLAMDRDALCMAGPPNVTIRTREGDMRAEHGDWIIKEPFPTDDRKFYPCKPGIVESSYVFLDGGFADEPKSPAIGSERSRGPLGID